MCKKCALWSACWLMVIYFTSAEGIAAVKSDQALSTTSLTKSLPSSSVSGKSASKPVTKTEPEKPHSLYPWKKNVVTTNFWIGQGASGYDSTTNYQSAWDASWTKNYGGLDDPLRRFGFLPKRFAATLNPFYVALPFNDVKFPDLAKKWVPWWKPQAPNEHYISQCKGHWLQIRCANGKSCYAQWEDVGPFRYDHAEYVFGTARPTTYNKAGLDVSPAVKTYLGLCGMDLTDWRFVEAWEVPPGPWLKYGEQAILFTALKQQVLKQGPHEN